MVSDLIRDARQRHGLDQRALARRAGTSQAQISRIERGETSPTVETVERLLASLGEELRLAADPLPTGNVPPAELRAQFVETTPEQRLAQVAELSRVMTSIRRAS